MSISFLSSFVYSLIFKFFCLASSFSSIVSKVHLLFSSFHLFQFHSNLPQYSLSYLLSDHPNNFFAINLSGNSPLLNVPFSLSYFLISSISCQYSFSNSSIASFAFSKFSLLSQISDSAMNPFYCVKYLSFSFTHRLFRILSTSHSSSPLIITGAGYSFLCPSTCSTYLHILLMLTTRCILTVLGSSNSTVFDDTIFFTL